MSAWLSLEEAQQRLLALAPPKRIVPCSLSALGSHHYVAQDLIAARTQPSADLSAMDGYALAGGDTAWHNVGESRAGAPFTGSLDNGQCVRISTGAHMPKGADRVLIQENARVEGDTVYPQMHPKPGQNIRKKGFDFTEGQPVIAKGAPLTAAMRALAMAAGHNEIPVFAKPRIAVLESGDELVAPGQPASAHTIQATNGTMVAAMLHPYCDPIDIRGPVRDDHAALAQALAQEDGTDIVITSGGASVGDHDLVQDALERWGATINFWKVAIKPGKPLLVATREGANGPQVILGLPGNPVSTFVTAFLFALPLVRAAMGSSTHLPQTIQMRAAHDLPQTGARREFLRASHDQNTVRLAGSQDSSALVALAGANGLIDRPAHSEPVRAGDIVPVYNLQIG